MPAPDCAVATEVARDEAALAALGEAWRRLEAPSVFLTWEWAEAWWRSYGADRRPWVVAARDGAGEIRALAPLCLTAARVGPLPAGRLLTWIGAGEVCADHLDLIAPDDASAAALLDAVWRHRGEWDGLWWTDLPEASPTRALLVRWAEEHGMDLEERVQEECTVLPLPPSWSAVEAGLSGHFRRHLRRDERRLFQDHEARVAFCERPEDVPRFLEILEGLHGARHAAGGAFARAAFRDFHRALAPALCRRGWLRLAVLETPQQPLAAIYAFAHGGVASFYQSGLSDAAPHLSRGQVLLAALVRRAVAEGMRTFDFLRGQDGYKDRWTQQRRRTFAIFATQRSLGGRWAGAARAGRRRLRSLVGPRGS